GRAGRVRLTADAPLLERRMMSAGAAWIVAEALAANPRPGERVETFDLRDRPRVAWKTGTSYGFRDAWALGATRRHTVGGWGARVRTVDRAGRPRVAGKTGPGYGFRAAGALGATRRHAGGVWVGRPDGTPLPGQYGAITALPLLFEVIDSLPRAAGDGVPLPPPSGVERREVCWPLGTEARSQSDALCQRRLQAWVLDGVVPPTFAERGARWWSAGRVRFQVDARSGARLSAACTQGREVREVEIARWPALLSPWLPLAQRSASRLPPLAPGCADDGRQALDGLRIEGVQDGARLA